MLGRSTVLPCSSPSTSFAATSTLRQPRRPASRSIAAALVTDTPRPKAVESNGSRNGNGKVGEGGPTIINGQVYPASPPMRFLCCNAAHSCYQRIASGDSNCLMGQHCTGSRLHRAIACKHRHCRINEEGVDAESGLRRCCTASTYISLT